jgi:hypothetical protein
MARLILAPIALASILLSNAVAHAPALAETVAYATMGAFSDYLMPDRNDEIALAQSAAPSSISGSATVLVLGPHGYETAKHGTSGFTCLVERGWMSPFDSTQFWNPKLRGPICYNPPASRSILRYDFERTRLVLEGLSRAQMLARMESAFAAKKLPQPEPGSMSYMMSKHQNLGDGVGPWHPHLMFNVPKADGAQEGASWGANLPGSPIVWDSGHHVNPEPQTIFMIPVGMWSDGTAAPHISGM